MWDKDSRHGCVWKKIRCEKRRRRGIRGENSPKFVFRQICLSPTLLLFPLSRDGKFVFVGCRRVNKSLVTLFQLRSLLTYLQIFKLISPLSNQSFFEENFVFLLYFSLGRVDGRNFKVGPLSSTVLFSFFNSGKRVRLEFHSGVPYVLLGGTHARWKSG